MTNRSRLLSSVRNCKAFFTTQEQSAIALAIVMAIHGDDLPYRTVKREVENIGGELVFALPTLDASIRYEARKALHTYRMRSMPHRNVA